jgi:hypothetical protein
MRRDPETKTYTFATTSKYTNSRSSDCVIRSISLALGKSWEEVFDSLCEIARKMYRVPNEKAVYEKYLELQGWKKMPMPRRADNKRIPAKDFCAIIDEVVCVKVGSHHLSCIKNHKIHDIWDCGDFCVGNYWVKCSEVKEVQKSPKKTTKKVSAADWDTTPRNRECQVATGGWNNTGWI